MTKDVDTDLSEIFRAMQDSCGSTLGDSPPPPRIRPIALKGERQKRTLFPIVAVLALLGIALTYLMLFHR